MSAGWNFADVWETVADTCPDAVAQIHGDASIVWRTFDAHANGVAAALLAAGLARQDKVALYLYNTPAYLESAFGALKAALVPVNTNYRYRDAELAYLWDNADAAAVVFDHRFVDVVAPLRQRLPRVRLWIDVVDQPAQCPAWAMPYSAAASGAKQRVRAPWGRSGDDLILIYTGGTTGRPKGVMWRQHDLYCASNTTRDPTVASQEHVRQRLRDGSLPPVGLPAGPLMHGTAFVFACTLLNRAGAVVTMTEPGFDAARLLDTVVRRRVTELCIVGDAFCRPLVDVLDESPGRYDLTALKVISSSGMMWSAEVKQRLLRHAPHLLLIDFLNSSEASGMARSITSNRDAAGTARFQLGKNAFVIDDDGRPVAPGSAKAGRIAVRGIVPLGYYKDPDKTAATFPVIDGVRCSVPGDWGKVEADGSITLLGRGSTCINTGGEKVFPEEVEETLKTHPGVVDAIVVGVPDERLGQVVAAIVAARPGALVDPGALRTFVRERLAGYKAPRHVMVVESIERNPTGKGDYPAARARIVEWLAQAPA